MTNHASWRAVDCSLVTDSEKWAQCDDAARVLWLHLLLRCDNYGTFNGDVDSVWVQCGKPIAWGRAKTERALAALIDIGLVHAWTEGRSEWANLINFDEHQHSEFLRKRGVRRSPKPPTDTPENAKGRTYSRRTRTNNKDKNKDLKTLVGQMPDTDSATIVFDQWKTLFKKTQATILDPRRRRRIEWAVKTYGLEATQKSLVGYSLDDWPDRKKHHDLTLLFRDAEHFERGLALADQRPATNGYADVASRVIRV